jgi:4-aminobutyrate aminotransferase-like enzyme
MIDPKLVHETLKRHQLADGYPFVFDLDRSHGSWLHDSKSGAEYLDCFTCFASWPIGYSHPGMKEPRFVAELLWLRRTIRRTRTCTRRRWRSSSRPSRAT